VNRNALATLACAALAAALFAVPAAAQKAPDTLARIKAAKQINVAFSGDSLPFSFVDPSGKAAGYSIDLCQKVIALVGRTVGNTDLKVRWLVGSAAERVQMVASGKADLDCANTTASQSRMEKVDFSNLIFVDGGGFLVGAATPIQKFADMTDKKIGVIAGTTTEMRLRAVMKERLVNATVVLVKDGNEGVAMLESGSLDAFASDKVKLVGLASQAKDPSKLAMLADDLSYEPYAFAVPRNDSNFRLVVNKALTQTYASGAIEPIFNQWLGVLGRPTPLVSAMYILSSVPL
jgi:glutamate/aspartate transport system substrate-binding protein